MKSAELKQLLLDIFGHLDDRQLFAITMYGEARGETDMGRIAQGSVVLERVEHREWDGTTVKEVCLMPRQFSCFLPNDKNFPKLQAIAENWAEAWSKLPSLQNCYHLAAGLLNNVIPRDIVIAKNHCTQYVAIAWRTMLDAQAADLAAAGREEQLAALDKKRWWIRMRLVATIGTHEFYA